jgi:hypothetical protein
MTAHLENFGDALCMISVVVDDQNVFRRAPLSFDPPARNLTETAPSFAI